MLAHLKLWLDATPREGALNMALDEAMLAQADEAWLRVYQWIEPTISFGFSQNPDSITKPSPEHPIVRRWTGGGVVFHDGDWTYALAVPAKMALSDQQASTTYRWIHESMIAAMLEVGIGDCELQPESTTDGMGVCFIEPAKFDVVWRGEKIAGAAQRRAKIGFLHQGTIQQVKLPPEFSAYFAKALSSEVEVADAAEIESALMPRALDLVRTKYGTIEWLSDRVVTK